MNEELMSAYLDDELAPEQAQAFERLLADSPAAKAELAELRKMLTLVAALPEEQAPPDFYEKLSRKLHRKQARKLDNPWLTLVVLPFQVLSILVILAVAALFMMAELDDKPRPLERDPEADFDQEGPRGPSPVPATSTRRDPG